METLIVHPNNKEQLTALKAFMKAFKISFEEKEAPAYNPDFVAMVQEGMEQIKRGETTIVNIDDL
jgi:ribosomal protein S20